jgi:hypothetical protein
MTLIWHGLEISHETLYDRVVAGEICRSRALVIGDHLAQSEHRPQASKPNKRVADETSIQRPAITPAKPNQKAANQNKN